MNTLSRRHPIQEMLDLQRTMDRMMDRAFYAPGFSSQTELDLPMDVTENDNEFVVKASIPGVNPDDLEITYNDHTLSIKGEIKQPEVEENVRYHVRERWFGAFSRSLTLPVPINADAIQAEYEGGVLILHLPKTEEVKPRRISIKAEPQKTIEGRFGNGKKEK